jgi:hypothetical protein
MARIVATKEQVTIVLSFEEAEHVCENLGNLKESFDSLSHAFLFYCELASALERLTGAEY